MKNKITSFVKLHLPVLLPAIIIIILVSSILGYSVYRLENNSDFLDDEISSLQETIESLQKDVDKYVSNIQPLESRAAELESVNDDIAQSFSTAQDTLDKKQKELESAEARIDELSVLENQQSEIDELNGRAESLQQENAELREQISSLEASQTSGRSSGSNTSSQEEDDTPRGAIVYWTPGGKVYHSTPNCSTLKRSKTIYEGTISESGKSRGCKVCY